MRSPGESTARMHDTHTHTHTHTHLRISFWGGSCVRRDEEEVHRYASNATVEDVSTALRLLVLTTLMLTARLCAHLLIQAHVIPFVACCLLPP